MDFEIKINYNAIVIDLGILDAYPSDTIRDNDMYEAIEAALYENPTIPCYLKATVIPTLGDNAFVLERLKQHNLENITFIFGADDFEIKKAV